MPAANNINTIFFIVFVIQLFYSYGIDNRVYVFRRGLYFFAIRHLVACMPS